MRDEQLSYLTAFATEKLGLIGSSNRFNVNNGTKVCFSLPNSIPTLTKLFGYKRTLKLLFSPQNRFQSGIRLHGDALVLPLGHNDGIVMASANKNAVLKVVKGQNEERKIGNEVAAGALFNGRLDICPEILDHGNSPEGGYHWVIQEMWPDTHPVETDEVQEFANLELATPLLNAYKQTEFKSLPLPEWLAGLERSASEKLRTSDLFESVINRIKKSHHFEAIPVYTSRFHGDLYLKHIHRNRKGWKIIDWGHFERGIVLEDWLSLELKTERNRWYKQSLVSRLETAGSMNDLNRSLLLDWPGPLLTGIYGSRISEPEILKVLIYTTLAERLIRLEELVNIDPHEIDWLMAALDFKGSRL
jgi:hypothetical protein